MCFRGGLGARPIQGVLCILMQVDQINEPVQVLAAFRAHGVEPLVFKWGGKDYKIVKVNLIHTETEGRERVHIFSVSGEGAVYRLAYRPLAFTWTLEEIWIE